MADAGVLATGADVLTGLMVCGIAGLLGQGVRAIVGLKNANSNNNQAPNRQTEFNAAYLLISLMIGFVAGVLAGLLIGLDHFINNVSMQSIFGVAGAGYAGADFIENSMSLVIPITAPKSDEIQGSTKSENQPNPLKTDADNTAVATPHNSTLLSFVGTIAPMDPSDPYLSNALHRVAEHVDIGKWVPALSKGFAKFDLTTDRRKAAAVGQFLTEAGRDFGEVKEDLYYTHASAVLSAFKGHFNTEAEATPYLRSPAKLANKVYADRLGNGNEASGDGYRYRGRGLIQLTGKDEYAAFALAAGLTVEEASEFCETPEGAAVSGCWYLQSRNCLSYADKWDIRMVTLLVNGKGLLGLQQRIADSNSMLKFISSSG